MRKGKSAALFIICMLLVGFLAYSGFYGLTVGDYRLQSFSETINRGLDLQGGMSVVEEIVVEEDQEKTEEKKADEEKKESEEAEEKEEKEEKEKAQDLMDRTIELLSIRVNKLGVAETVVAQEGDNRIRIEIPGKFDSEEVLELIGKTGELKFVGPDGETVLTGADVKNAYPARDQFGSPEVHLEFNAEGTEKFAKATEKFLGQPITIYMDDEFVSAPKVSSVIREGNAVMTGNYTVEEARSTANIIKSGALPVKLKTVSYKTVGATLGQNALPLSMKAAQIGVLLVLIFMLLYYRIPGLIADIALVLFIVLDLLVFSEIGATLTLAGIAGLLLTIGMAVDANVLIFERIKEELRTGKSVKSAVDAGFKRALSSILDANITTIIAGLVLYFIGTGSVKGFALTLMIGIVISIFTALTATKHLLKWAINMGLLKKATHFGVKRG